MHGGDLGDEEAAKRARGRIGRHLARFYLRDARAQWRIAASVLSTGDVFVPKTDSELEWVLRTWWTSRKAIQCLAHLIALPGITVEDRGTKSTQR